MTDYKLYPNLPSAPPENPQVAYHLSIIRAKMQGLKNKEQMFKQKYEKYNKILNRLSWLNACSSRISIATGISSVATFATFIRIPVSILLGAASMTGAIASGILSVLAKKYQKKLKKVTKLIDIVTPALVVFERVISGALKDGIIDEEEFNTLQMLYLETLNELTDVDRRMEAENRPLVEKSLMEEIKELKKPHYQVTIPNQMHQFDLLCMPSDSLYANKYKYILAGIDAASRFKVARPLRAKQARDVAEMIADIYKVGPLTYPKTFQCDNGSEFKGEVTKMLEKQEVKIQRVMMKYKHTHTAFVEAFNKILAERLFKVQDAQELNDPEKYHRGGLSICMGYLKSLTIWKLK